MARRSGAGLSGFNSGFVAMIQPEQVFLLVTPVDMRWSIERLSLLVQQTQGRSPCDGTAYGFTNRTYSRLKLLIWDGNGVWLCQRRLHSGRFHWPTLDEATFTISDIFTQVKFHRCLARSLGRQVRVTNENQ